MMLQVNLLSLLSLILSFCAFRAEKNNEREEEVRFMRR
jgi:hypothetical protein